MIHDHTLQILESANHDLLELMNKYHALVGNFYKSSMVYHRYYTISSCNFAYNLGIESLLGVLW
jgi:hypothetical protein